MGLMSMLLSVVGCDQQRIEQLEEGKKLKQKDKYNLVIEKFAFIKLDTALSTEYSKNRPNIPVLTDLIEESL